MAKHDIRFSVHERSIENSDVVFRVSSDGQRLGDLYISKGGVDWRSKGAHTAKHKFDWETFAALLERG